MRLLFLKQPQANYVLTIIIINLISAGLIVSGLLTKPSPKAQVLSAQNIPSPEPLPQELQDIKTLNFLLLGYGGPGHDGGFLTDAILIVHINFDQKKVSLISVPRDLWIKFPDGVSRKINAAFIHNGAIATNTKETLSQETAQAASKTTKKLVAQVTGLPINYFVAIDFVGLQRAIGQVLKGIEVNVGQTLDDPWYPIQGRELDLCGLSSQELAEIHQKYTGFELQKQFPCRYERLHFDKGRVVMDGADVLKYVRSRHSGRGDFDRSRRQAEVLVGVKNKLVKLNALDEAAKFFQSLLYTIQTDLDSSVVAYLAPLIKLAADFEINSIHLDDTNVLTASRSSGGASILLPKASESNFQAIHSFIESQL